MKTAIRAILVAALAVPAVALTGGIASAGGPGGFGTNPPPGNTKPPGQPSGPPATTTVKHCSLYATSTNYGETCYTGGSSGDVTTVKDILGKQQFPCWDELVSDQDLVHKYGIPLDTKNPAAPYYLHSCITGLDLNSSLYYQPNVQLNQFVFTIPTGSAECPRPYKPEYTGKCIMTLTDKQRIVVGALTSQGQQIPEPVIVPDPDGDVRTNESVTYHVAPLDSHGRSQRSTQHVNIGGVDLYAVRSDNVVMYPYGKHGKAHPCTGDTSGPNACTWTYKESSAHQDGLVYPFRIEVQWTVVYVTDGQTHVLAHFTKPADLDLPVKDVQTVVVGNP